MDNIVLTSSHITEYTHFLKEEERAAATVEKYLRDIRAFVLWMDGGQVTKEAVIRWKSHLLESGQAPVTVNTKLSAINGLFRYLGWNDCRVKFLKVQRRVFRDTTQELTREEYNRLLNTARNQRMEWLELLMETICATGIRVSEVKYITIEALKAGRTDISLKGKIRTILLPDKLCRKLIKYAKKEKIASGAIYRTGKGDSLSRYQIWKAMKMLCVKAKVKTSKVFPHNLRHLFAATFYRVTRDIVKLADVLGHSSVETTRIYLIATGMEHLKQLERMGLVS